MKKLLVAGAAVVALVSGAAHAADLPYGRGNTYQAPVSSPSIGYNWTGYYLGGNVGYGWGGLTHSTLDPSGFVGGIQGGYNHQIGQVVLGVEADIAVTNIDDKFATQKWEQDYYGTLRGRLGWAWSNAMLYGTAGLAFARGEMTNAIGIKDNTTHTGWVMGVGLEVGLTQNWSVKGEYLYTDLLDESYFGAAVKNGYEGSTIRMGVNYRF